jgi:hypothetical protein
METMTSSRDPLTTNNNLKLQMTGPRVDSLAMNGYTLASAGGFVVRDGVAGGAFTRFTDALDLELTCDATVEGDHFRVTGLLTDTTGTDRAITLRFALPVAPARWEWWDDVRTNRPIEPGERYIHAIDMQTGARGEHSLYPLGAITAGVAGLCLATDMVACPAQTRIAWEDGTFVLEFDFGLAPETDAFPSAAPFSFILFSFDGNNGFRGALGTYQRIFAEYFSGGATKHGLWMPFADISEIDRFEDFGFTFHEGAVHSQFNADHGIGNYRYTEPSTWWMDMPEGMERSYENVERIIHEYANGDDEAFAKLAQVTLASVAHDEHGKMQYQSRDLPWCHGVCFSSNPNPNLPEPCEGRTLLWNEADREMLYGPDSSGLQAGEYLDSLEAYATEAENHRRDHFHHVTVPLTFSTESMSPCIHKAFSVFEFCKVLGADLHAMGKLLFCNSAPERYAFLTPFFDVMGIEVEWVDHDGNWIAPDDAVCNFKRAMMGTRPYALLLNTSFEHLTLEVAEHYFHRAMFYGFLPSMFSHNAADDLYWGRPEWYNRDRHFFVKYVPLCRELSEAGWQAMTHARSNNPNVYLERFGNEDAIYLTVLNASDTDQHATITIDADALGLTPTDELTDDVTGEPFPLARFNGSASLAVSVSAQRAMRFTLRAK